MNKKAKIAKKHLSKGRKMIIADPPSIFRLSKENVIKALRETRERLWEKTLASRH